jgi:hypothetical protein
MRCRSVSLQHTADTLLRACAAAGTGKTSSARLLSRRAALPLVYVPLEGLVSKWYGESEQNMAKVRGSQQAGICRVMCGGRLPALLHQSHMSVC